MFKFYHTLYYDIICYTVKNNLSEEEDIKTCTALFSLFTCVKDKKITYFYNNIYSNIFTNDDVKNMCLEIFCISQKTYGILNKFIRNYKIEKLSIKNKTDLALDNINDTKSLLKTVIIENNVKYCFKIVDLICLINNSLLSNIEHLYPCPNEIKNPYTNIPFLKSTLYNIFFTIKKSTFNMPILYNLYYISNFDIKKFCYDNEPLLRDILIKKYIKSIGNIRTFREIKRMFRDAKIIGNENKVKLKQIHSNFPPNVLLDVFTPFLDVYLHSVFSLNITKKYNSKIIIRKKFKAFFLENPLFGRKYIKKTNHLQNDIFVFGSHDITFATFETSVKNKFNHINIDSINIDNFLENSIGQNYIVPNILDLSINVQGINDDESDEDYDINTFINNNIPHGDTFDYYTD